MRLFVAIDLPGEVRDAIGELIARLKPLCKSARWTRPEAMHITLKFIGHAIGDADAQKLADARAALATVRSDAPVEMQFRGVGFFPDARRPRVVWCGVEASANLAQLAADVERALEPFGIPREERAFVPHLTLARFKSFGGTGKLVRAAEEMKAADFGAARETEFHLYQSILKDSGAEHKKIESYPFVKAGA
jgi:2'-5' RNA ligase